MEGISFEWASVSTEATLAVFAALILCMSAVASDRGAKWISLFAMFGFVAALAVEVFAPFGASSFGGALGGKSVFGVFAIACALLSALMGFQYFAKGARGRNEFFSILMICAAALILFVRTSNQTETTI